MGEVLVQVERGQLAERRAEMDAPAPTLQSGGRVQHHSLSLYHVFELGSGVSPE